MKKKKVLITGGNGDIAKAIATELENIGVFIIDAPDKEKMDVTNIESVNNYIRGFTPDILINNAGFILPQNITDGNPLIEKKSIEINLWGVFNCANAVLKRNPKASIINIGSSAATKSHKDWSSYCATKAAVVMATKCWSDEGINAVCVSPGRTATKMRTALYPREDKTTLLRPEDFAIIVRYAIEGKYQSGEHINVNINNVEELKRGINNHNLSI